MGWPVPQASLEQPDAMAETVMVAMAVAVERGSMESVPVLTAAMVVTAALAASPLARVMVAQAAREVPEDGARQALMELMQLRPAVLVRLVVLGVMAVAAVMAARAVPPLALVFQDALAMVAMAVTEAPVAMVATARRATPCLPMGGTAAPAVQEDLPALAAGQEAAMP